MEFHSMQLDTFWCTQLNTFPQLAKAVLEVLVSFAKTYLCESGFSTLLHIQTKARNRFEQGRTQEFLKRGAEILRKIFCSH